MSEVCAGMSNPLNAQRLAATHVAQDFSAQIGCSLPVSERAADFLARMMASLGQEQTTLRKTDYLRLCQMAARGL